jgi:hypothetical protein
VKKLTSVLICPVLIVASMLVLGTLLSSWLAKASSPHISVGEADVANRLRVGNFVSSTHTAMVTATPKLASIVVPKSVAKLTEAPATSVTWATWTATTTGVATGLATYTTGVRSPPSSPLLDRLVKNKPSIWGNKGFYALLGAIYLTLLGLFLKQIHNTLKRQL